MSPFMQRHLLREAEYYKWMGMAQKARDLLWEVAASIDNPNYRMPKRLRRQYRKEQSAYDAEKIRQQQQCG